MLLFIIAVIALVVVGLLVLGQIFYNRNQKKVGYLIWGISLIIPFYFIAGNFIKPQHIKDTEKSISGQYIIDVPNSKYDSLNLESFKNLVLKVNTDNTFSISQQTPFFKKLSGKWEYKDNGDFGYIECNFNNKNFEINDFKIFTFPSYALESSNNGDKISFLKKSSF